MNKSAHDAILKLYQQIIQAWNHRDAVGMAKHFSNEGVQIGLMGASWLEKVRFYPTFNRFSEITRPLRLSQR